MFVYEARLAFGTSLQWPLEELHGRARASFLSLLESDRECKPMTINC